jgi:hypothetical protein
LAFGGLHEVAGGGNGAVDGAAAALFAAGIAARTAGNVLGCVTRPDLFAPALEQAGLLPGKVICVEAGDEKSVLACFEEPHGRGDEAHHGGSGIDPRGMPKARDIVDPYEHIDRIKVKTRDFR